MFIKLKDRIDKKLIGFIRQTNKFYSLSKISPLLSAVIKDFALRDGKRLRPSLFILGYLGFAKKSAANLYTSALSLELLHDFMLIHDDIIDKSDKRRGKPSMHRMLNNYLRNSRNIKFTGEDLGIVSGDIMYAMAIGAFLSIKEKPIRKEKALRRFIQTTIHTAAGEFLELLTGIKDLKNITKQDIYKIYDLKTAAYTFASPLAIGATLAGANKSEVNKLFRYGVYLGRAFQIKDDILGIFAEERKIGKSILTDLQEAKKTLLIWYAYNHSPAEIKTKIQKILTKERVNYSDLLRIREIIIKSKTLDYAKKEILNLTKKARPVLTSSKMYPKYKKYLNNYSQELLSL